MEVSMQVGDLVKCIWQPRFSRRADLGRAGAMKYTIKGELGIIIKQYKRHCRVFFPRLEYAHDLADNTLKVII